MNDSPSNGDVLPLNTIDPEETRDPWILLSKAEDWCKLGLLDEAIVASDEAVEAELKTVFDKLGVPNPLNRERAIRTLKEEGVKFPNKNLLHLKKLREEVDRNERDGLTLPEAEEAISIAENFLSKISEQHETIANGNTVSTSSISASSKDKRGHSEYVTGKNETVSTLLMSSFGSLEPLPRRSKNTGQGEVEFITKLLLARAILDFRRRRVPRAIGLGVVLLSATASLFFVVIGVYGIIDTLSSRSFFSIFGLVFDCVFLFIAYFFVRIAIYLKGATR